MKTPPVIKFIVYALVVVLSLAAVLLVLISPAHILNSQVVYQGF